MTKELAQLFLSTRIQIILIDARGYMEVEKLLLLLSFTFLSLARRAVDLCRSMRGDTSCRLFLAVGVFCIASTFYIFYYQMHLSTKKKLL